MPGQLLRFVLLCSRLAFIAHFRCFPRLSAAVVGCCPTVRVPKKIGIAAKLGAHSSPPLSTAPVTCSIKKRTVLASHVRLTSCASVCLPTRDLVAHSSPAPSSPPPPHHLSFFLHRTIAGLWAWFGRHGLVWRCSPRETEQGTLLGSQVAKISAFTTLPQYPFCGSV